MKNLLWQSSVSFCHPFDSQHICSPGWYSIGKSWMSILQWLIFVHSCKISWPFNYLQNFQLIQYPEDFMPPPPLSGNARILGASHMHSQPTPYRCHLSYILYLRLSKKLGVFKCTGCHFVIFFYWMRYATKQRKHDPGQRGWTSTSVCVLAFFFTN